MKKVLLSSAALGALVAVSGAAQAADPLPVVTAPVVVTPAPMPAPPAFTWSGGYIGGHAALARGHLRDGEECNFVEGETTIPIYFLVTIPGEVVNTEFCEGNITGGTLDPTYAPPEGDPPQHYFIVEGGPDTRGYLAGAQIGFNKQLGSGAFGFVIGAEVAHSFANIQANFTSYDPSFFEEGVAWESRFEISRLTTATLRAGFAFGRVLAYGEVGLALAQASWTNSIGFTDTEMAHGLVYGGGLEISIGHNVSIFGEYNRVKLDHVFMGQVFLIFPTEVYVESRTNIFKVGFNIHL